MSSVQAIVLAAGKGTRMNNGVAKVLHPLCGQPLLGYVLEILKKAGAKDPVVVLGYQKEKVATAFKGIRTVHQSPLLGTGHAVQTALPHVKKEDPVLVINGDTPLVTPKTLKKLIRAHQKNKPAITFVTSFVESPKGYGRVIRTNGKVCRVQEERNASPEEKAIKEINAGFYCFDQKFLRAFIRHIKKDPVKKEFYITQLVEIAARKGLPIQTVQASEEEALGINSQRELANAAAVLFERKRNELMHRGVIIVSPETTFVEPKVKVGEGSIIYPFVYLHGNTRIGENCVIGSFTTILDSKVSSSTKIWGPAHLQNAHTGKNCSIGPFSRLRPGAILGDNVHIGNFVEIKKAMVGSGTKINHLTYIGDARVGQNVNIGAGTITCNYDGREKHPTVIKDGAFVGSDAVLIAPVTVGKNAYIAAGSAIHQDVPPGSLAIARERQRVIKGWAERKAKKKTDQKTHQAGE